MLVKFKKHTGGIVILNSGHISEIEELGLPGGYEYRSITMNNGNVHTVTNTIENIDNALSIYEIRQD
jgi:uncharacterized protein YlzI (FlbEa/FlbD family)